MYADLVKIHDQDALAISRGVWCEVQQLCNWYKATIRVVEGQWWGEEKG